MENEDETFQTSHSDDIRQKIAQMRESVELARSDIRRTKNEIDAQHNAHESHVRRTRALWVLVILLLAGLAGVSWYASPLLSEHRGLLGKFPALQTALDNVGARVASTEQQTGDWANDRSNFSNQMSNVEQKVGSNLKTLRNEARLMMQQIKYETGRSLQALQNRVSGVESIQREHSEEVAKLRTEIVGVRQELANVKEENVRQANHISQVEQAHQSTRNDLSGLDRRLSSNQTAVSSLAHQVDRKRVDFELQNGRTQEVVDGIYVTIKNTDVERQRIDGWVQIASDGRFIWLRGESAQHPIDFSSRADARALQLVFTQVGRNSAAGYVLVPTTATASNAAN
jgi:hypothetical protein